jgi:hypothetical protein
MKKIKISKNAGWMTGRASLRKLVRRILHAIMTEDKFTSSWEDLSAAADAAIFYESYITDQVLEPIFARLGVKHTAHNMGMGGLGTIHNGLAGEISTGRTWTCYFGTREDRKGKEPWDLFAGPVSEGRRCPCHMVYSIKFLQYLDERARGCRRLQLLVLSPRLRVREGYSKDS